MFNNCSSKSGGWGMKQPSLARSDPVDCLVIWQDRKSQLFGVLAGQKARGMNFINKKFGLMNCDVNGVGNAMILRSFPIITGLSKNKIDYIVCDQIELLNGPFCKQGETDA